MHMRRGEYMLEEVAKDAWEYGRKFLLQGKVADYIPELGKANPVHFGLCIKTEDGRHIEFAILNAVLLYRVSVKSFPSQPHCNTR